MSHLKIYLKMDNAAFAEGNRNYEVARILRAYADELVDAGEHVGALEANFYDLNGNYVGEASATVDDDDEDDEDDAEEGGGYY